MEAAGKLNAAEQRLWNAFHCGEHLDLRVNGSVEDGPQRGYEWGSERQIRADVIADMALSEEPRCPSGCVRWVLIRGARIIGPLNFRHAQVPCPISIEDSYLDDAFDVSFASMPALSLRRSCFVGRGAARGLKVVGNLDFVGTIGGSINLFGAYVGGHVWMNGTKLDAAGEGWALSAPNMVVGGGMYCRDGFEACGGVNLYGAKIGTTLEFNGASLIADGKLALRAPNLDVKDDFYCTNIITKGLVNLFGARVGGHVWMNGTKLDAAGERWALSAPNMVVGGGMYCRDGFEACGGVNLYGAKIGATLEFNGASLIADGRTALRAPHLNVNEDFLCKDCFKTAGTFDLVGLEVRGLLSLEGTDLGESLVRCNNARLDTLRLEGMTKPPKELDLSSASVRTIHDDPSCWPERLALEMLTYDSLEPYMEPRRRLAWLGRSSAPSEPQPYEQLAAYYRRLGREEDARTVLLAKHRHMRPERKFLGKLWGYMQDCMVGYGYRPSRALVWLTAFVALTSLYFAHYPPHAIDASKAPPFQSTIYAVDLLLPILDFGQKKAYIADGPGQWIAWGATLVGWVLTTAVVVGVTRLLARDR